MTESFDTSAAAAVLRELAAEIRAADGAARNGLFLELHRLYDTIFRLSLASHPELPPGLHGAAFNLENPLPAPQVVRELNRLGSPLASTEIRNLYKHMNMARNNMAHDSFIGRVTVSRSNVKRMTELALLVARVLEPEQAEARAAGDIVRARWSLSRARLYLITGITAGAMAGWAWGGAGNDMLAAGISIAALGVVIGAWMFSNG